MLHDSNYYGMYRGIVMDSADPKDLGRVKLMIPQVSGEEVTDWAWPVTGAISQFKYPYGNFSSLATQTVTAADTETIATFSVEEDTNNVTLVDSSKITVKETGDYFLQFSAQFAKSGSSAAQADIWLKKNGVNIPNTNSRVTMQGNPNEVLITLNYVLDLHADDYIQIAFSSADAATQIKYYGETTSPTRPALPSIIASVNLIGKYVPRAGTQVWAAFEGGDPNFPLWIGAA